MTDILNIDDIKQQLAQFARERNWPQFHTAKNLSMAATCEAAELQEIFQWMTAEESLAARDDNGITQRVSHEIADVMLYLIQLAVVMNINISSAIKEKIALNSKKYPAREV